ncbi:MAG: tRNA (adenosine(37)-N6)-threonylcarbamoyltransferase complex dimerization subunit type 1 TsaB [Deltaproteobacteria bacterium]|nr:tRNA (adenosine(37)-N6)-threonylcarbamoyltransferase complex dimerization subunit type 1 TsaB [Deltaproteobacteria bacterium]
MPRTPLILAFDTSTDTAVVAVGRGSRPLAIRHEPAPRAYDEGLVPRIVEALQEADVRAEDLEVVACGCGPGSFTGLRIALATAKGYAFALGLPLVLVPSTGAMAAAVRGCRSVVAVLDAKRGQIFAQAFDLHGWRTRLSAGPRETARAILDPGELASWTAARRLARPRAMIGAAAPPDGLADPVRAPFLPVRFPPGPELLALARRAFLAGRVAALDEAEPEYIRPPPFNRPSGGPRGAKGSRG